MNNSGPTIFMTAAEASGDHHAAELIRQLRTILPNARFIGAAGPKMAAEGCEVVVDLTKKASMLGGAVAGFFYYLKMVKLIKKTMAEIKPDILVPVDSPAFNWHMARQAKKIGIPVMYYVAPQVWAWAPWRIKKVRRLTDHVACLLPFEQDYFTSRGVKATYVGHPLFDQLPPQRPLEECPDLATPFANGKWTVAFLPGSRPGELANNTPLMAEVAADIKKEYPDARCVFTAVNETAAKTIKSLTSNVDIEIVTAKTPDILADSHFAVTASGTVTLEVAHFGVPQVIIYKVGLIERILYKLFINKLIRTKYLSLVNIVAQKPLVPELMPIGLDRQLVSKTVLDTLADYGCLCEMQKNQLVLTAPLKADCPGGASAKVANIVKGMLEK